MTMHDDEIERRLRATLAGEAGRVRTEDLTDRTAPAGFAARAAGPRRVARWAPALAAAAVAAVVAATVFATSRDTNPAPSSAAAVPPATSRAAAPTPVTYVRVSGAETIETWIPADRSQQWLSKQQRDWGGPMVERAKCGGFPVGESATTSGGKRVPGKIHSGCNEDGWGYFSSKFLDSLPDDPAAVLASMRRASGTHTDAETFFTGYDTLSLGRAQPAAVRKIVAALTQLPGTRTKGKTLSYSGRIKRTVLEHWALTLDATGTRVVATSFSYGSHRAWANTITYRTVGHLGER